MKKEEVVKELDDIKEKLGLLGELVEDELVASQVPNRDRLSLLLHEAAWIVAEDTNLWPKRKVLPTVDQVINGAGGKPVVLAMRIVTAYYGWFEEAYGSTDMVEFRRDIISRWLKDDRAKDFWVQP